jgi:large subunit ribosomal protein L23
MDSHQIIIAPINTEKTYALQNQGKIAFRVSSRATKISIKKAILEFYGVKAIKVTISNVKSKTRTIRRSTTFTKRRSYKKAIIQLEKGKKIDVSKLATPKKK